MAGSLPPPAERRGLLLELPPCSPRTGMLLPHHPPGFTPARSPPKPQDLAVPKEGSVPSILTHQRDISMPSLQAQDPNMRHGSFAAGRKGNIWADVAQQHGTSGSCLADGPSRGAKEPQGALSSEQHVPKVPAGSEQSPHHPKKKKHGTNPGGHQNLMDPQSLLKVMETAPQPRLSPRGR